MGGSDKLEVMSQGETPRIAFIGSCCGRLRLARYITHEHNRPENERGDKLAEGKQVPDSGPTFDLMMREIDAFLAGEGVSIPARPIRAVMEVGRRNRVSLPMFTKFIGGPPEVRRHLQLTKNIYGWYKGQYGDRTKIDFSPGSIVVVVDGDLYRLKVPLVYGAVSVVIQRDFINRNAGFSEGPALCNILQMVEGLTPIKAASLSDCVLCSVADCFDLAFRAHYVLEANKDQKLIGIARGDIQTAVSNLLDPVQRNGESKWASLQAAEKILKASIV